MRAETYDNLQQGYRSDGKQLAPTHFLARCGVTDSATIANVQRISLDGNAATRAMDLVATIGAFARYAISSIIGRAELILIMALNSIALRPHISETLYNRRINRTKYTSSTSFG
jgi:hypothetical protein